MKRELLGMLSTMRPAWSKTETRFIADWLAPLGCEPDAIGNMIIRIGDDPILWSCHTDTVHRASGYQAVEENDGIVTLAPFQAQINCLGADDTAGVWLMREMIKAKKPGLYIFHRAEEIGGVGSSHIAKHTPHLLDGIKFAVAFDRKGHNSVITHQFSRCCSDRFAAELCMQLKTYLPDDGGVFTDTANYTDIIPECTNISVGYDNEHTHYEKLDINHLINLLPKVLALDVTRFPVARDPERDNDDVADFSPWNKYASIEAYEDDDLVKLIKKYPYSVAAELRKYGITYEDLAHEITAY